MQEKIGPVIAAINETIVALTKFNAVIQNLNDAGVFSFNDAEQAMTPATQQPVTPVTAAPLPGQPATTPAPAPAATQPAAGGVELDDEGVPWCEEIHTKNKSKVNSKIVRGGKRWGKARGLSEEVYQAKLAELKAGVDGATTTAPDTPASTPVNPVAIQTPAAAPGAPGVPTSPAATNVPANPPAQTEEWERVRQQCIAIIKQMTDAYGLTIQDCQDILVNEFKVAQNGDTVAFGALTYDQFQPVLDYFTGVRDLYESARVASENLYALAGDANKASIDEGFAGLYAQYHTDQLGGIHYTKIAEFNQKLMDWYAQWQAFLNGAQA